MFDVRFVSSAAPPVPDLDTPLLASALTDAGISVDVADWRDPAVDWASARVTMLRSPWDYVHHLDEFVAWAERANAVTALWNPFELIRWNTHKAYLLELHGRGRAGAADRGLARGSAASLDAICDAQGWNAVVIKPTDRERRRRRAPRGRRRRRVAGPPRRVARDRRRARAALRPGRRAGG